MHLLYFGRVLLGLSLGLVSAPAGVYVTEISTPAWRTTFNGGLSAFYMLGMVTIFIFGKVCSVHDYSHKYSYLILLGSKLEEFGWSIVFVPNAHNDAHVFCPRVSILACHSR